MTTATLPAVGPYIVDTHWVQLQLVEDQQRAGRLVARGRFGLVENATNNGRFYKKRLMQRELGRLDESIKERGLYGELDHPADGRTKLDRVSHLITALYIEGDEIIGEAEILDTDKGRNLKAIVEAGGKVGVSSRGMGTCTPGPNGQKIVNEDYRLISFDFVAEPATTGAHPKFFNEASGEYEDVQYSADELRAAFPDQIRELELLAESRVRFTDAEQVAKAEARARDKLRDEFAAKLGEELSKLKAAMKPVDEETQADVDRKIREATDRAVQAEENLTASMAEKAALKKTLDKVADTAKQLGFRYRMADRLLDLDEEQRKAVQLQIEKPEKFATIPELDEAIDTVVRKVKEDRDEEARQERRRRRIERQRRQIADAEAEVAEERTKVKQVAEEAKTVLRTERAQLEQLQEQLGERETQMTSFRQQVAAALGQLKEEISELRDERDQLEGRLAKAVQIGEELGTQAYAQEQLSKRPDAPRMRKILKRNKPRSRRDVDTLLEGFKEAVDPDSEFARIRGHVKKSRPVLSEQDHEDGGHDSLIPGASWGELERLCGIGDE